MSGIFDKIADQQAAKFDAKLKEFERSIGDKISALEKKIDKLLENYDK